MKPSLKLTIFIGITVLFHAWTTGSSHCSEKATPATKGPPVLWSIEDKVMEPESVYFHAESKSIFLSNIHGEGTAKDESGWIQKLDWKGKVIDAQWVRGLNAPKGMRAHNGTLWVSDIDRLVGIDLKTGKITFKKRLAGAKFLNDVAIGKDGTVYVSDTLSSRIYQLNPKGKLSLFAKGTQLESPNGLLVHDGALIVASWGWTTDWSTKTPGRLLSIDLKSKKITPITLKPLGNLDGLELDRNGNYLVSDWSKGTVYRVTPLGKVSTIYQAQPGTADIGLIPDYNTLLVPHMKGNRLDALAIRDK